MTDDTERPDASSTTTRKTKRRSPAATRLDDNVRALFGDDVVGQKPDDPDGIRPPSMPVAGPRRAKDKIYKGKNGKPRKTPPRPRVRMGSRMSEVRENVDKGVYTMEEFVSTLTPEELIKGQMMDHEGKFRGRPPSWVPQEFHQACVRELLKRGDDIWKGAYLTAIEVMERIAKDANAKEADRIKAAVYIIERVAGKVPEKLVAEIGVKDPWEDIITGIVAEAEDANIARAAQILTGTAVPDDEESDPE